MMKRRWIAFSLALALLLPGCGGVRADTVTLRRTEGTVALTNDGKSATPRDGMKLYSGCELSTEAASYAWLDLDDAKLAKLDQDSGVHIYKNGKTLEIEVSSGSLFFNISRPLEDDETMDIRTSTMMVGIRGTCGWVEAESPSVTRVYLLEGTVAVTAAAIGYEVELSAGEVAEVQSANGDTSVSVRRFGAEEVPAFVAAELREDGRLALAIRDASGLDLLSRRPAAAWGTGGTPLRGGLLSAHVGDVIAPLAQRPSRSPDGDLSNQRRA